MPQNNFLSMLIYIFGIALMVALFATVIAFGATIFVLSFTYVFIPLLIIACVRWVWYKIKNKHESITYYDDRN